MEDNNCDLCPICYEKEDLYELECKHKVHLSCLSLSFNIECPLCRYVLKDIPEYVKESITERHKIYKKECEEEERREIIESLQESNEIILTPEQETFAAISYLRAYFQHHDLPISFIPRDIILDFQNANMISRPGHIFENIVTEVFFNLENNIDDFESLSESQDSYGEQNTNDSQDSYDEFI